MTKISSRWSRGKRGRMHRLRYRRKIVYKAVLDYAYYITCVI